MKRYRTGGRDMTTKRERKNDRLKSDKEERKTEINS